MIRIIGRLLSILTLLLAAGHAAAHTRSESHSAWTVDGDAVDVVYAIPNLELRKLGDGGLPPLAAWHDYVRRHLWATAGPERCRLARPPAALAADDVFQRIDLRFVCPEARPIVLHATAFLDVAPNHMHFAQIRIGDDFTEQLFTADRTELNLSGGAGGALRDASFATYVAMGIEHILTGVDHMSFLLGLVLLARRVRDVLLVVTGFTIGHSLTLALAVTGLVRPQAQYIDALVALTILLIGAENIALATRRPGLVASMIAALLGLVGVAHLFGAVTLPPLLIVGAGLFSCCYLMVSGRLVDAARARLVVTIVFGLVHGFGFAAGLLEMELPRDKLFELLLGFNLGVEIGQVSLVLLMIGVTMLLRRVRLAPPRALVVDTAAALLAGTGTFWLVTRSVAL